ncbi:RNA polymerase sigma24 factor [Microtetraspora sp. NBRC 13810]|uniref:RNA polymerase sigma-70 factor n=1 Tax=Microtetraspora sp. NBRC 13810 TaxID=3030990 RepID=UPI0024A2077C|nr:RNA polymerase sigma-70 factor [Microtetraspora sp. NBRC 13810]GLW07518.1 RNA polymerase sigma24 factor [Microtetraspora sp. NBRC 13810]
MKPGERTRVFEEHRPMLFGIAYRMLGSVTDAEDIVQDAWLRWNDTTTPVREPRAYLARTVTNLSINRLRSVAVQRESYVGPWLPEPLVTTHDAADEVELAESISMALLVVLESLSPLERAVFVLKEVFGFSYVEIGQALGRAETAVRQVGRRARSHVEARRPRFESSPEVRRRVTEEFLNACLGGDINRVMEMLAPDVTAWTDGGGKVRAALRPMRGAEVVARWLVAMIDQGRAAWGFRPAEINGMPGLLITTVGGVDSVSAIDVTDGKISTIWLVRNPDKFKGVAHV